MTKDRGSRTCSGVPRVAGSDGGLREVTSGFGSSGLQPLDVVAASYGVWTIEEESSPASEAAFLHLDLLRVSD